jgi:radical SAM protein with 4Fe4S-binding SPASM domain
MAAMTKGCLGGQGFAFISNIGRLQICGFLDVPCGDLRSDEYNFKKIWETSPVFLQVRAQDEYEGRCGYCEYRNVCGGCRARAYAETGNYLGEEPYCVHEPARKDPRVKESST